MLSSLYIIFNSSVPYIIQRWINLSFSGTSIKSTVHFGILFLIGMTIVVVCDYIGAYILILLREKTRKQMRRNLTSALLHMPLEKIEKKQSGYWAQLLMNDVEIASSVIVSFVYMVLPAVIGLPAAIIFASLISPVFAYTGIIGFAILAIVLYFSSKHIRKFSYERQEAYARVGEKITEVIGTSFLIKLFNAENAVLTRSEKELSTLLNESVKKNSFSYFIQVVSEFIKNFLEITAILIALIFSVRAKLSGAGIMAGVVYLSRIWQPVVLMGEINEELQSSFASIDRINDLIMKEGNEEKEKIKTTHLTSVQSIECRKVALKYNGEMVVENISFVVKKGECLGLKGKSGVGKTTLAKAILGYHSELDGEILINGTDIHFFGNIPEIIGYLPQFVPILNDTVWFNIVLSNNYDEKKLYSALNRAGLSEFIEKRSEGNNNVISDNKLSGGEKKRIGIARLLYRNYNAVILDEPFSGIDEKTAKAIYREIEEIFKNKTVILISHEKQYLEKCTNAVEIYT